MYMEHVDNKGKEKKIYWERPALKDLVEWLAKGEE